jgi:hypothetical protein
MAWRTFKNVARESTVQQVHALQDALKVSEQSPGIFQIPNWDEASRKAPALPIGALSV